MNEQNKIKLFNEAQNQEINPPADSWTKLEDRLKNNSAERSKGLAIQIKPIYLKFAAASIVVLLMVSVVIKKYSNQNIPVTYAINTALESDELSFPNDRNIYQLNQLNTLREAYKKLSTKY